jgi:hypothetical protein
MLAILYLLGTLLADLFKSRSMLEAENLFLRHQLNIALRRTPRRLRLRGSDRALMVWLVRLWPSLLSAAQVVQADTILRWHRAGVRAYWRWKSRGPCLRFDSSPVNGWCLTVKWTPDLGLVITVKEVTVSG